MKRFLALALLAALAACGKKQDLPALARLDYYSFEAASPLESRIKEIPADILKFYAAEDKRPDYAAYRPSAADKALLLEYLRLLPPEYEKVFKARCVGVYFIDGLIGNGITNWAVDPEGKIYFHITLNPAALRQDLSETMTERERSCFKPKAGWDVRVQAGVKYKGLLYALAHEAAHGLDYAVGVSQYTDDTMPSALRPKKWLTGNFFESLWIDYRKAQPAGEFPGRDRITFYGLGGGPKLDISEASELYRGLRSSGFSSLYGARSRAEDLAELETLRLIASDLGQPLRITLTGPGVKHTLRPMDGLAGRRAAQLRLFMEKINDLAL